MPERELTDVDHVDVKYETESYSVFDAVREEWALWLGAVGALVFTAIAATQSLTASPFDQFLFGAIAVAVTLAAAGRTVHLSDLL